MTDGISLDGVNPQPGVFPPDEDLGWFGDIKSPKMITASPEIISEEYADDDKSRSRLHSPRTENLDRSAKSGIPGVDEWRHFFSRILIKTAADFYVDWAFRGIDEDWLTDREVAKICLTDEERDRVSRPFAEFAYKSKFMRKHGREIIATGDSIEAIIQLGVWYSRVNRIAGKYRRMGRNGIQPANAAQQRQQERETAHAPRAASQRMQTFVPEPAGDDDNDSAGPRKEARFRPAVNGQLSPIGDYS